MLLINDFNPSANFLQALDCETFYTTGSKKNSLQDITQNIIECFTIKQDVTHVVIPVPYAQSLDLATVEENQISVEQSWQKIFSQIITLASFLDATNVQYLIFDMCNNFEYRHIKGLQGFDKLKLINDNKNIINLFEFCGNKFMYDQLPADEQKNIDAYMWQHHQDEYKALENYLIDYLNRKL
jgi:hypothetical protein|tara:strand:- start:1110 stop:1658 length:549 start_codon:yes stop_codon:yes gene_type:complete